MAFRMSIPVTSDNDCIRFYVVEYKKDFETTYQTLSPNPTQSPIIIDGLDGGETYNVRIKAMCCNGQYSPLALITQEIVPS